MLRSRVRASTSVDMAHNCWQENCGFLTARGDQSSGKRKCNAHTDEDVEEGRRIDEDDEDVEEALSIDEDDDPLNIKDDPFTARMMKKKYLLINISNSLQRVSLLHQQGGASWHEHQLRFQCLYQGQASVLHPAGRCCQFELSRW